MKASELRVGNMVNLGVVYKIEEDRFYVYDKDGTNFGSYWVKIEPIPLTEEWLLMFGFDNKFNKGKFNIIPKGRLGYKNGRTYFNSWTILEKQPDYVHELQNLYFTLTGEELTIK